MAQKKVVKKAVTKKTTSKKAVKKDSAKDKQNLEQAAINELDSLPKDARDKLEKIKDSLEKFKDVLLERFDDNIMGVALLPPNEEKGKEDDINVLVLVDDTDSKKMAKEELHEKLQKAFTDIAGKVHEKLVVHSILLTELWQQCYDGKHDGLQMIAMSAPVHDKGMLAAIKVSEIHKSMVIKKFEKYIVSYVLGGSITQGRATPESDVDVFIVIDDTDVKKMTRIELRDKLRSIIIGMGAEAGQATGITNKLNIQVWLLTDYWDSIKDAHPVMFTFLRDGIPFYDRGMFMPWKQLLQMGRIKPSPEAIDMFMHSGGQMLERMKLKFRDMVMEDLFYAVLNPSQAAVMMYGIPPTTPRETYEVMNDVFVKKEGLIEAEYVKTLKDIVSLHKDIEHGKRNNITGSEIDDLSERAEKYLVRLQELFKDIEKKRRENDVLNIYESVITIVRDVLRLEGLESVDEKNIAKEFKEKVVKRGVVPEQFGRLFDVIIKAKKSYDAKKLNKYDISEVKKNGKELTTALVEHIQRKRGAEMEKTKIRVKYDGSKFAEIILLGEKAFIIYDLDSENKRITKSDITPMGSIVKETDISVEEFEHAIVNTELPPRVFIKNAIFEDIKKMFGKDVEILISS